MYMISQSLFYFKFKICMISYILKHVASQYLLLDIAHLQPFSWGTKFL